MNHQTIHITSPISRDDLDAVIAGLEVACPGTHIEIVEGFDLVVTDNRQARALNALFGNNVKSNKIPSLVPSPHPHPQTHLHHIKAWRLFLPGSDLLSELITIEEKNRRLAAGEFEPGTILHHPKTGRQQVIGAKGNSQTLSLAHVPE